MAEMADLDLILAFVQCTQEEYDALENYDEGTLYFAEDTKSFYKGSNLYNGGIVLVSALPTKPALGVLYILTSTWVGQVWTGTTWKVISKPYDTEIAPNASDNSVPTSKAVKTYVDKAVSDVTGGKMFVSGVTYNTTNTALVIAKGEEAIEVSIDGMVHNATYDTSTRKVTLPIAGGTNIEFIIPEDKDLVVKAGKYVPASEEIWLSIDPAGSYDNPDNVIKIPVAELIDTIVTANTDTVKLTYDKSTNTLKADVIIDPTAGNALTSSSKGLMVDISGKIDKLSGATGDKVVITNTDGTVKESIVAIGSDTLSNSTSNLAIEKAVKDYADNSYSNATNFSNTNLQAAKNYTNTVNANMSNYVANAIKNAFKWKSLN